MAEIDTGGGAHIGRDASAGRDFAGRDSYHEAPAGNRVDIHTGRPPSEFDNKSDSDAIREMWIALLGDKWNSRNNPGLVRTVEDLSDRFASLLAANGAQSYRLDVAEKERASISENQRAIIASVREYRKDNDDRVAGLASRQAALMTMMWVMSAVLLVEGAVLLFMSI